MKSTIIVEDNAIIVDGKYVAGINLSTLKKKGISVIQWDETEGEIEYSDGRCNEKINSIDSYKTFFTAYNKKHKANIETERLNVPNDPFYVWSDVDERWVVDESARIAYYDKENLAFKKTSMPTECHEWDEVIQDWVLNEECVQLNTKKNYLITTDWYLARQYETGIPTPEDVLIAREQAREYIRKNDPDQQS